MNLQIITSSEIPLVMKKSLNWDILKWSVNDWNTLLNNPPEKYPFRFGLQSCSKNPQWERNCQVNYLTFSDFFEKFKENDYVKDWCYFDYKHIEEWLGEKGEKMDINWKDFGFPDKTAKDSTLWIGTKGAHTPCHIDTYGCNLVAQVYGRKRWYLFPPSETENLQPTRIPYEESSIYSNLNFFCGCCDFSAIKVVYMVDLDPGDVLFVPFHWWHYVENLSSAISVNIWIPSDRDDMCRVEESLVKYFISSVCKTLSTEETKYILNPNEDDLPNIKESHNLEELSWCLKKSKETENKISSANLVNENQLTYISSEKLTKNLKLKCKPPYGTGTSEKLCSLRTNIINAYCHPEVITLVRKKLQNTYLP